MIDEEARDQAVAGDKGRHDRFGSGRFDGASLG
jgi:hypothetical protein